ncbi:MAG: 1-deoxy-D-xylulose-5-phosphate reductoisomerase [Chitinophagales bacterium]|nr:1-deoxy-D-xylulose-5-phosphate reductoisomerase [Chitinophagales bacterium]MDW8428325.1 1-deoxy-D-xylulose-5-phosphate reductoisomerase [Chitinophagales bacterium]
MSQVRRVAILGSTGSIGRQAIEVIEAFPEAIAADVLVTHSNAELLIEQAKRLRPRQVVIVHAALYHRVCEALAGTGIRVAAGQEAVLAAVQQPQVDVVLAAMVGYAGLLPVLAAAQAGKHIALANKEALVVAGALITTEVRRYGGCLIPVDSEHSAIFQCVAGEAHQSVRRIILTASGGPFRGMNIDQLRHVRPQQALQHPNWKMGEKITIDSATLMNKGLEVIEAHWLFGLPAERIEVVIHPQSIIHSMVEFSDGSLKAQLGLPDMRLPIQYALTYPQRLSGPWPRLDLLQVGPLTFEPADRNTFRNLALAYEALRLGGNMPCVLNAANEVAVQAFLKERISFPTISRIIEQCMSEADFIGQPGLEDYIETDRWTRQKAQALIETS